MSDEEKASPLDLLRAGVTQGKQRVQVHNLKNEQSQLDKRRRQAVVELGELAWQERLTHPDYSSTFAGLVKLERQRTDLQRQLDDVLTRISQQERLKGQLNEGFAARIDEVQAQKRAGAARLSKVMSSKLAAEQRLAEGQEPNSAEIERLKGEQQAIQSEISQHDGEMAAISDESRRTMRPIDEQLSQLQNEVRAIKEQTAALVSQMKLIMPVLGERVLTVRPEAAQLAERYQQIDALDRQVVQKAEQIATLEQQIATASPTAKRVLYLLVGTAATAILLLLIWFALTLFGGNGLQAAAQTYADAIVEQDYETLVVFFERRVLADGLEPEVVSEAEKEKMVELFKFSYSEATLKYEQLEGAVALAPHIQEDDHAEVVVVWHHANTDVAQILEWKLIDNSEWVLTKMGDYIEGELDGETFIATEPVSQAASDNQSEPEQVPIITATPSAFTLQVQLEQSGQLPNQATVTLLELDQTLEFKREVVRFDNIPLGRYTVRVSAQGFEDKDHEVEARGDQPLPDTLLVQLGEPLPLDPNNVLLLSTGPPNYQLVSITDKGIIPHWNRQLSLDGWSPDFKTLKFHDGSGIGRIDITGQATIEWTIPEDVQSTRSTQYRPDLQEIAYIQNNDIFTLATEKGAEPVRWSQIGLYKNILGWFDKDTLLVGTDSGQAQLMRRDGTSYQFLDQRISNNNLVFDREGRLRFVYIFDFPDTIFYQPGPNEAERRVQLRPSSYLKRWTSDNNYYLLHSELNEAGATSGLLALSQDGQLRQVAPQLLAANYNLVASALAPLGSQMVLSWRAEEQAGLYIADAESQNTQRISDIVPDNVFWPAPNALVYVIEEGDKIGTWHLPLDGGEAEQLFAYRAENVTGTPDGRLLLVANNTLWEYDGTHIPRVIGEEGATQINSNSEFVWPQIEDATASIQATVVIPTISAERASRSSDGTATVVAEATPVAQLSDATATTVAEAEATPVTLPSDATPTAAVLGTETAVALQETATAVTLQGTATAIAFETAVAVALEETTTAVASAATPLPPTETPTASSDASPTETAEAAQEAADGAILARIDLLGFDSINVRDLDGYTGTPYAQVAIIDNTQSTFNAIARSPDGLWIYVSLQDGTLGWIASEYVVASQPLSLLPERVPLAAPEIGASITLSTYEFINVRAAPTLDALPVTEIHDANTRFVAVGLSQDTEWVLVRLADGTLGWIVQEFVIGDQSLDGLPKRFYTVR